MKTLEELQAVRETYHKQLNLRREDHTRTRVIVAMDTCGIASGAKPVLMTFSDRPVKSAGAEDHPAALWNRQGGRRRTDAERSGRYAGDFPVLYIPAGKKDHETVEKGNDPI